MLTVAACSSSNQSDAPSNTQSGASSTSSATTAGGVPESTPDPGPTSPSAPDPTPPAAPPTSLGLPGLDDPDEFCATWVATLGTVYVLRIAGAFGDGDASALARAEVVAAPAFQAAGDALELATWPGEIADERALLEGFLAPYRARAARVLAALAAAGATEADLDAMRAAWEATLRRWDPDDAAIPLVDPGTGDVLDAATDSVAAAEVPFDVDPSIADAGMRMPSTQLWLQQHCPALAQIGVGDAV